uniref:NAD(P)(+)--arginine ADP-ribosyltransferase n=1 Tax=Neobodo designis TaxID=312471 RepID=A0A7S1R321_NEODS|mmetsp:Transcript_7551/g.23556  ORF Transcript_7551/g.23556 Transcript_7551/m.23556 type:complete len:336 (+) Transcript_7551:314-1321(+)
MVANGQACFSHELGTAAPRRITICYLRGFVAFAVDGHFIGGINVDGNYRLGVSLTRQGQIAEIVSIAPCPVLLCTSLGVESDPAAHFTGITHMPHEHLKNPTRREKIWIGERYNAKTGLELIANLKNLGSVFPGIGNMDRMVDESLAHAQKRLSEPHSVNLSEDQALVIALYTFDHGDYSRRRENFYHFLNEALRARDPAVIRALHSFLYHFRRAVVQFPKAHAGAKVYRGIDKDARTLVQENYKLGHSVYWTAFTSVSMDPSFAQHTFCGLRGVLFKVQVTEAYDICEFSMERKEQELLLLPNAKLVCIGIRDADSKHLVCTLQQESAVDPFVF